MIAQLTGKLISSGDGEAIIDVSGVGYLLFCSRRTLDRFGALGSPVVAQVETHVREDHIHLFGFADQEERAWFKLLTTVQGVGPRVGLNILSVADSDQLTLALAAGDKAALVRADGVGPKLAARILSELKDKAGALAASSGGVSLPPTTGGSGPAAADGSVREEAISALVNLGYGRAEAFTAVGKAAAELGEGAGVEALIPGALKVLAA